MTVRPHPVLVALACAALVAACAAAEAAESTRPTATLRSSDATSLRSTSVGAIRWDGWWRGSPYAACLDPAQWRHRLPFYGKAVGPDKVELSPESQQVMDAEIAYARQAGLSYWAFDYYQPKSWDKADAYNYGLRLYLSSRHKLGLNFCLILLPPGSLGPAAEWPATVATLVEWFRRPDYQKVPGNRPLVYFFTGDEVEKFFGSKAAARAGLDTLRRKAVDAGLGPPYLVAQVWSAQAGADCVSKYGFDAISAYAMLDFSGGNQEYPYGALAAAAQSYWDACKATGKQVVPLAMAGWDKRPLLGDAWKTLYPPQRPGPWYAAPTPAELAEHVAAALEWNARNAALRQAQDRPAPPGQGRPEPRRGAACAEANTVLIYAWNESGEGGWLVPTLNEGSARIAALRKVLRSAQRGNKGAAGGTGLRASENREAP